MWLKALVWLLVWIVACIAGNLIGRMIIIKGLRKEYDRLEKLYNEVIAAFPLIRCNDCDHFCEYTEECKELRGFDGTCLLIPCTRDGDGPKDERKADDFCSKAKPIKTEVEE